jgi:hypothetical protein
MIKGERGRVPMFHSLEWAVGFVQGARAGWMSVHTAHDIKNLTSAFVG